ncbi:hypothetical protein CK203_065428 [Vitis vinifera]|uniref:Transposase-associated domain-containing protein n=1 Tax=Vitis vinifera TaxID=29760 RepID=A0A438FP64_VITVI|nr:hypothetical protein CK203_065428 [Vitis vinifera]
MDRSWMSKDRMSQEYEEGVEYFINFALEHCPNQSGIRCPCMRCGNLIHHTPNKIREDMFFNGIDQSYHTWYWHKEAGPSSRQPIEMAQCYDTMDCGDVVSTVEMVHVVDDEFMTDPISFKKLLEDAEKPLYPSCIKFTKLSTLVKLYNVKAWNELNDASSCPTCGTSRWKVNKAGARNTKRIPEKVLWYFPPIPRFKRMFRYPKIPKDLKWHAKDCRNLRLVISAYGMNPHSSMTREVGVKAYDAHQREFFTLKAILLWTINDFPAYGNLSGCTVKGYHACPICGEETNSHWLKHGNKNSYTGHRRFLPCNHPFRSKRRHLMVNKSLEKNVCESIIETVLNIPGKTKDGVKSRLDLLEMGLRPGLAPINLVSMEELKLNGLKSHDYHALMQQLLPVAIRSVLLKHVRYAITRLCFFFNALCAKVLDVSRLNDLQQDIVVTLCLLEKYFPPSIFDIMLHLIVHLVREVRLCGPVYMRWMYPFERYMKVLKSYVQNHNCPERCIAECYIVVEALVFCIEYLSGRDAIGIPSSMKDEWKCGKPLLGGRAITIHDYKLVEEAHHYVLQNTTIVQPFIE